MLQLGSSGFVLSLKLFSSRKWKYRNKKKIRHDKSYSNSIKTREMLLLEIKWNCMTEFTSELEAQ